jgi:hypothetical protein
MAPDRVHMPTSIIFHVFHTLWSCHPPTSCIDRWERLEAFAGGEPSMTAIQRDIAAFCGHGGRVQIVIGGRICGLSLNSFSIGDQNRGVDFRMTMNFLREVKSLTINK